MTMYEEEDPKKPDGGSSNYKKLTSTPLSFHPMNSQFMNPPS